MKKKSLYLFLLCMAAISRLVAQPAGQSAPDAKMLSSTSPTGQGLSSLSSPNLFDGSTTIGIPIYQYEGPGGDYGISFSYNTKGIKVDMISSAIGLGWSLSAGGSLIRNVRDLPDEINITGPDTSELSGLYNGTPTSGIFMPSVYQRFKGKYVTYSETPTELAQTRTYRDRETDEFNVSAGPLSFSFQMAADGSFFTIPENRARIELLLDGTPVSGIDSSQAVGSNNYSLLLSFRITDAQGNRYYFTRGDYERRRIYDDYTGDNLLVSYWFTSKWDLEKVVLASGATIRFTYSNAYASSVPYYNQSFSKEGLDVSGTSFGSGAVSTEEGYYSKILAIDYPNGTRADFIYDSLPRCDYNTGALREITISGGDNCMRYKLDQAYFMASNTGTSTGSERAYGDCYTPGSTQPDYTRRLHRLKLKGIRIYSCDNSVSEPYYSFDYDSGRLPMRLDDHQDYFGYANAAPATPGSANFNYMVPTHKQWRTGTNVSGRDKSENITYAQSSVLTTVKNAYGGQLQLSYGAHYNGLGNPAALTNVMSGLPTDDNFLGKDANDGLRLDAVVETDKYHPGNGRVTYYTYENGRRFTPGGYFHYPTVIDESNGDSISQVVFNGLYISPHQLINGSNHGYSTVTVRTTDGSQQLSKRVITFSNIADSLYYIPGGGKKFWEFPYTDKTYMKSWMIGLPLTVTDYDENNYKLQETFNQYTFGYEEAASIENIRVGRLQRRNVNYSGLPIGIWQKRDSTDTYRPVRGRADLSRTVTRKYVSDSRYIQDTALFYYDDRHNLYATEATNSKGQVIRSVNVFNYNIANTPGAPVTALNDDRLELLLSTERWTTNGSSNDKLLDASITGYHYDHGKLWAKNMYKPEAGSPLPYATYETNPSDPHQKVNDAFNGDALTYMRKLSEVIAWDAKGNPLESRLVDRDQYKAMIWDTTTGRKLAEAGNCRYQDLCFTSFEETWPPLLTQVTMGNFTFMPAGVSTGAGLGDGPISGRKAYKLHAGSGAATLTSGILANDKSYRLSFWVKGSTPPSMTLSGSAMYFSSANLLYTCGSWRNYQIDFVPATNGSVVLSSPGSDVYIDEVRLCPTRTRMQSSTYEPLQGISSSTDASGRITYYEYDKLGRRTLVRDQDGNILSKTEQVVQGQD